MDPAVTAAVTAATSASTGISAAAAVKAQRQREEEEMMSYSDRDLADDWEFKILRSSSAVYKNPDRMREILETEARAGWIFVEKFDNNRIRLKRSPKARENDRHLEFDPYRTTVSTSQGNQAVIIGVVVGLVIAGILAAIVGVVAFK